MNDAGQPQRRHAVITGASGFIGSSLLSRLKETGCRVTVLGRQRPPGLEADDVFAAWRIGDPVPESALAGADWIFHLAYDWHADTDDPAASPNLHAVRALRDAARTAGAARFVYAGSQSAAAAAPTRYGAVKQAAERLLDGERELAVRIAFVCGGSWRGPAGQLLDVMRRTPFLPAPAGPPAVQPIHVDDVAAGLIALAERGWSEKTLPALAGSERFPFGAFAAALARARLDRRVVPIPVPRALLTGLASILRGSLRDRVAGLAAMEPIESALPPGIDVRSLDDILAPDRDRQSRRALIREGRALTGRMTSTAPPADLVYRYARALRAEARSPLGLPRNRLACGLALRWREMALRETDVRDRLGYALALVEAHPESRRLLAERRRGAAPALRAVAGMAADLAFGIVGKAIR